MSLREALAEFPELARADLDIEGLVLEIEQIVSVYKDIQLRQKVRSNPKAVMVRYERMRDACSQLIEDLRADQKEGFDTFDDAVFRYGYRSHGPVDAPAMPSIDVMIGYLQEIRDTSDLRRSVQRTEPLFPLLGGGRDYVTGWVWPVLFEIWFRYTNKISLSEGGPLFRFMKEVHRHYRLSDPNFQTMRKVHARWLKEERKWEGVL